MFSRHHSPEFQAEAGKLLIAGASGDPVHGGMFIFKNASKEVITTLFTSLTLLFAYCAPVCSCNGVRLPGLHWSCVAL